MTARSSDLQLHWAIVSLRYVDQFFLKYQAKIKEHFNEINAYSEDLVRHTIYKDKDSMRIRDEKDLKELCVYIIFTATFYHSYIHFKVRR